MVRESAPDPFEITSRIWSGYYGAQLGFDVGANCGQSIGHMFDVCQRVMAFEPNRDSFSLMQEKWGTDPRVTLLGLAVSSHTGPVRLAQLGGEQAESGQLVTLGLKGMEWEPEDWSAVQVEEFPAWCLDDLAEDFGFPDFVKVDTEGHEAEVLRGARRLISEYVPDWLIEFHSPENHATCVDLLQSWSSGAYEIEVVRHPHYPEASRMWFQHGWVKAIAR